jgi:hypothetical protein
MTADCCVLIPAYRDQELVPTLNDLFANAEQPRKLRVVVAWQHDPDDRLPASLHRRRNLTVLDIPAKESRGPNWARRKLQRLYDGERYTLFLDSHHRFVPGWDRRAIAIQEDLRDSGVPKPLLTAYLPPYDPARDPRGRQREVVKIYPLKRTDGLLTHLTGRSLPFPGRLRKPIPASFLSLHFLFADGGFHHDVPFDPSIYFFGDEVLTGLRAYLRGYDLYHPHRILGWHLYDRATRVPHWNDHRDWASRERRTFEKMRTMFQQPAAKNPAGQRTVAMYEEIIGLPLVV